MRFVADLQTGETPVAQIARAIGADPVWSSGRWASSGVEIAHWEVQGPHQFRYGEQSCYGVAFVHGPLANHLLVRNDKLVRQGRVCADRFRVATPGDVIGAQVTSPDMITMTHLSFSSVALETLACDLAIPDAPIRLTDPTWDRRSRDIEAVSRLIHRGICDSGTPDGARLEFLAFYAISTILRDGGAHPPARRSRSRVSQRVDRAIRFIEGNLDRAIGLPEIAGAACVSKFHLCRIFRDETGTTPHAFLQTRRLAEAIRLLTETSVDLDEIAFRTGFASGASLSGALRRRFGTGPAAIRRG